MTDFVELEVYSKSNPTQLLDVLNARLTPTYLEEMKDSGGGGFQISVYDPKILENPTLLDYRNVLKFKVGEEVVGAFVLNKKDTVIVGDSAVSEMIVVAGEGLRTWFTDANIYPAQGIKVGSQKERFFNFATERGAWYTDADWVTPKNILLVHSPGNGWAAAPAEWPDSPNSYWIWSSTGTATMAPGGTCYFRCEFTAPTTGQYSIFMTVDDQFTAYMDGAKLMVSDASEVHTWAKTERIDISLDAGTHVFAVEATNSSNPAYTTNPGGLLATIFSVGNAAIPTAAQIITTTGQANWKVLPYPTVIPGWSPGEIMLKLLAEAAARQVLFPTWITPTFTATLDSNGVLWDRSLDWSFNIGDSILSVLEKMEELVCDAWIDPSTLQFHMAITRGVDRSASATAPVIFKKGKNLLPSSVSGSGNVKNALLVQTDTGWQEAVDSDTVSVLSYGRVEGKLETGLSPLISQQVATTIFSQKSLPEEGASYEVVPTEGHIPFKDFHVGDWVLAPNAVGLGVKRRVVSLSVSEDIAGNPVYSVEFDTIFRDNEDKLARWLARLDSAGSFGGQFSNTASSSSSNSVGLPIVTQPRPTSPIPLVPLSPTGLSVTSVGSWSTDGVDVVSTVTATWSAVTTNSDTSATVPQFYEVWAYLNGDPDSLQRYATVTTNTAVMQFPANAALSFKVRALNPGGGIGEYSTVFTHTTIGPTTPMLAPDTPTLASNKGVLNVAWTGLLATTVTPPQFRYVYAVVSTSSAGTYTRMGTTLGRDGRNISVTGLTVGTAYWVKLIAVDGAGISSSASAFATTTLTGINLGNLDSDVSTAITAAQDAADAAGSSATDATAAAASAQTQANTATTNAATAQTAADAALSTANGKNKIIFSTSNASGTTGYVAGDIWFKKTGTVITGQWEFVSGAWASRTIDNAVIANLDAGKITTGYLSAARIEAGSIVIGALSGGVQTSITDAQATADSANDLTQAWRTTGTTTIDGGQITADSLTANSITSNKLLIGNFNNLLEDNSFESNSTIIWDNATANVTKVTTTPRTGSYALRAKASTAAYEITRHSQAIPVEAGESYIFGAWVRAEGAGVLTEGGIELSVAHGTTEAVTATTVDVGNSIDVFPATYTYFYGLWIVPAGAKFARPRLVVRADVGNVNVYLLDDITFYQQIPGTLVVDGAITASKIGAEEVVAGKLAANSVVTENLQAYSITALQLAADSVTADAILAKSIGADQITAGAITVNELSSEVGSNLNISSNNSVTIISGQIDAVQADANATGSSLAEMQTYYTFGATGAVVSMPSSPFALALRNDRIEMLENGNVVSYWNSGQMYVSSFVGEEVILGNHKLEKYGTGTVVRSL